MRKTVAIGILLLPLLVACAEDDSNQSANALFVEANKLLLDAVNAAQDADATMNYRNALAKLDLIVTKYSASNIAVQLASGQQIGDFSRAQIERKWSVPSGSMKPTLQVGDVFVVLKYPTGSIPQQGHIVAYLLPRDRSTSFAQRLIGLGGDRIQIINGLLHINEKPIKRERIDDYVEQEGGRTTRVKRWLETLPNGAMLHTLDLIDNGFFDNTEVYAVPPDHFFMMGDNRDNATDSRVLSQVGYVPVGNIVGRVIRP